MYPNLGSQYNFIQRVGIGGTGVVNLAVDTHSGFPVAIKSLHESIMQDNPEMTRKLRIEANIYLMLTHPNIVKLKNFIINDIAHLVMEFVDGKPLDEYISNVTGPIPSDVSLEMFKEIVSAIGYAHNKRIAIPGYDGVLHLDIKPSNILIANTGSIKVIDYGISQGSTQEREDKIMGTPMYMAPEQFDLNKDLDNRTDIYSLGVLLHQMVTGQTPYSRTIQMPELKEKIIKEALPRIKNIYPYANISFQKIIDLCTAKDPNHRYQNCDELLTDLEKL